MYDIPHALIGQHTCFMTSQNMHTSDIFSFCFYFVNLYFIKGIKKLACCALYW